MSYSPERMNINITDINQAFDSLFKEDKTNSKVGMTSKQQPSINARARAFRESNKGLKERVVQ